jgi:hypothetical protein
LIAGCGAKQQLNWAFEPPPKKAEVMRNALVAKTEVVSLSQAMQDLLGGEWSVDTDTWSWCETSEGREGVSYMLFSQRIYQPLPADTKKVAERAKAIWARFGHPTEIVHDDVMTPPRHILSDPPWLAGTKPNGQLFQFTVGDNYADFLGHSQCVLGGEEYLDLIEE